MEFNRLVSLVLGFIVLILLFVWISNRFRANTTTAGNNTTPSVTKTVTPTKKPGMGWNPFGFLSGNSNTPTPKNGKARTSITPSKVIVKITTVQTQRQNESTNQNNVETNQIITGGKKDVVYKNYKSGKTIVVNEIPETGAPTIIMTLALAGLSGGIYLRRRV